MASTTLRLAQEVRLTLNQYVQCNGLILHTCVHRPASSDSQERVSQDKKQASMQLKVVT